MPGATEEEQKVLGALGGIAAVVGQSQLARWPIPVRTWAESAPLPPDELVEGVCDQLGKYEDPLSILYDASISSANRRRLGTVFTPKPLVDHMVMLAASMLDEAPACVVDPGAGVGVFSIAAARRWPSARVLAVDINIVTLGLLAARLAFEIDANPEGAASERSIELVLGDYLDELPSLYGTADGPILALGNPPYTRVQELPRSYREKATACGSDIPASGHANLATLFQTATLTHMGKRDTSCLVVPGSASYTHASRGLRGSLWSSSRPVTVHRTPATTRAFTGRSVQAMVIAIGPERVRRSPLRLARLELGARSVKAIESWTQKRTEEEPGNWFWSAPEDPDASDRVRLGEVATVRRGVATGASKVFFLTDEQAATLPDEATVPAVPTLREFSGSVLDERASADMGAGGGRRWLLALPPKGSLPRSVADYLRPFEEEVKGRHLPSQRERWYSIEDLPRPEIVISTLSKNGFKVVRNQLGAVPSNNLFGITVRDGLDPDRLANWLRSEAGQRELRRVSRRYHGGSHKLEPGALKNALVPRPSS